MAYDPSNCRVYRGEQCQITEGHYSINADRFDKTMHRTGLSAMSNLGVDTVSISQAVASEAALRLNSMSVSERVEDVELQDRVAWLSREALTAASDANENLVTRAA